LSFNVLNYYDVTKNEKEDNLVDIYYYLYYFNKSEGQSGKYNQNFENKYKKSNLIAEKKRLKKELIIIILLKKINR